MTTSRRDFLVAGSSALALSALPARTLAQATSADARAETLLLSLIHI